MRKSSKKKSKKEKYWDKLPTLASVVGRRSSPGKSTKSPKKKRNGLQLACASSMSTSHMVHEEEDTQNTKMRCLSDMVESSNEEDSASTNPRITGPTNVETRSETQDKNSFQDHHTLSDEVFSVDNNMTVTEMLRAGFTMLKQGQQLFHPSIWQCRNR